MEGWLLLVAVIIAALDPYGVHLPIHHGPLLVLAFLVWVLRPAYRRWAKWRAERKERERAEVQAFEAALAQQAAYAEKLRDEYVAAKRRVDGEVAAFEKEFYREAHADKILQALSAAYRRR